MNNFPARRLRHIASALLVLTALGACGGHSSTSAHHTPASSAPASSTPASGSSAHSAAPALKKLEHRYGARLGVYALDTGSGRTVGYRADERFAFASTYKVPAAAVLLRTASDADLAHVITYRAADLQDYSPITRPHLSTGMTLRALIDAALRYSDNTAANLLLDRIGGPKALQRALRGLGDSTTHVDRAEPGVNTAVPGDVRDTSTPRALGTDLRGFALGGLLPAKRRDQLNTMLLHNTTGGPYIRAGAPAGWKVGDKTGNGGYGTRNDIAVLRPPHGSPVVLAVLTDRGRPDAASDDALIADATKATLAALR